MMRASVPRLPSLLFFLCIHPPPLCVCLCVRVRVRGCAYVGVGFSDGCRTPSIAVPPLSLHWSPAPIIVARMCRHRCACVEPVLYRLEYTYRRAHARVQNEARMEE